MRIAVTRRIPEAGLRLLEQAGDVELWPEQLPPDRSKLLDLAKGRTGCSACLPIPLTVHCRHIADCQGCEQFRGRI